jgi:hypothetical protein
MLTFARVAAAMASRVESMMTDAEALLSKRL